MTRPSRGTKRHIKWARTANHDLEAGYAYLRQQSLTKAKRFAAAIFEAIDSLSYNPQLGPAALDLIPSGRYRHIVVDRYRIIYRIDGDEILILRIWDARRNPANLDPEG